MDKTLSLHFYKSVCSMQNAFNRVKKQMVIMYYLGNERVSEAEKEEDF